MKDSKGSIYEALKQVANYNREQQPLAEATLTVNDFTGKTDDGSNADSPNEPSHEKGSLRSRIKIKVIGAGNFGGDKVQMTGSEEDLISYAKRHLGGEGDTLAQVASSISESTELNERIKTAGKTKFAGKTFNQQTEVRNIKKVITMVNKLAKDMDKWQYPGSVLGPHKIYDALTAVENACYDHMIDVEDGKYDGDIEVG